MRALVVLALIANACGPCVEVITVPEATAPVLGPKFAAPCVPTDGHPCSFNLPGAPDAQPATLHRIVRFMAAGDTNTVGVIYPGTLGSYRTALWSTATANGMLMDFIGDQANGPGYSTTGGGTITLDGGLLDHGHEGFNYYAIEDWSSYYTRHQLARELRPDIVALNLGSYNVNQGGFNATTEATAYAALVDQILSDCTGLSSLFGDCKIIIVNVPPQSTGSYTTNAIAFNAQLATIAASRPRTVVVDLYTAVAPWGATNFYDAVNLNATGMAAWAPLMWSAMLRLF